MPRPSDSFALLDKHGPALRPSTYVREFGPFAYTYIVGYQSLLETLLMLEPNFETLPDLREHVKGQRVRARGAIQDTWKVRYENGDWGNCNESQIGKACSGEPLRFDKACIAIMALDLVFAESSESAVRSVDVYDYLKLRPAIFVLREPSGRALDFLRGHHRNTNDYSELLSLLSPTHVRQRDEESDKVRQLQEFLKGAAAGHGMTLNNATIVSDYFTEQNLGTPRIEALEARNDNGRLTNNKFCNRAEPAFISLAEETMQRLQSLTQPKRPKSAKDWDAS